VDLLQLVTLLTIAGLCAVIAEWVLGFSPGGFLISIIVGVIGAYLGTSFALLFPFLPPLLPIQIGGSGFDLVWAVIGSLLLLLLLHLLRNDGRARLSFRR
jgi:uncharacterized membrane protein YeaQ/YmgE (transglycosylase-associated protein family)